LVKFPDSNRIDFQDYLDSHEDLKKAFGDDIWQARMHWENNGKFEGRSVKLKNIDYEKVEDFIVDKISVGSWGGPFLNMVTSLYNEENPDRLKEYVLALKMNIRNQLIDRIYVFYDMSNGWNSEIGRLLEDYKVSWIEVYGRPSFRDLFEFTNIVGDGLTWMVCNGDIVPSWDFCRVACLDDLGDRMLSITRWEFISENEMSVFSLGGRIPNILSQDSWVYQTPLKYPEELRKVKMGTMLCDSNLNYLFKKHNLPIYNPCLDLRTFHIHFQNARSYSPGDMSNKLFPYTWKGCEDFVEETRYEPDAPCVEACRLEDIK
jgi:hypothetical protein